MGVPAVASDISGNSEIVADGVTGLLFPPGDHIALAARLEAVLRDPALRTGFSARSVSLVREKFSTAIMARRTLDYYLELLAARAR
jgi:glycosyltransferase involved in cell wall biosynthesis